MNTFEISVSPSQRREINRLMQLGHSFNCALSILGLGKSGAQRAAERLADQRKYKATYNYQD